MHAAAILVMSLLAVAAGDQLAAAGDTATPPATIINATCTTFGTTFGGTYPDYSYCMHVLSSDPSAAAAAKDRHDVTIIAANATSQNVKLTVKLIDGLGSESGLAECKVAYGGMGEKVDGALADLVAGRSHVVAANTLSDASYDPVKCDVALSKGTRGAFDKDSLYQENARNFVLAHFASTIAMRFSGN